MPRARWLLAAATIPFVAVVGWEGYNRASFGSFLPPPARVDYCTRRYYPSDQPHHVNLAHIKAFLALNHVTNLRQIGTDGWGEPYFAELDDANHCMYNGVLYTFFVFVKVGSDDYIGYVLSGGP
jgi:hypothetical protein